MTMLAARPRRHRTVRRSARRIRFGAAVVAVLAGLLVPAIASAHPLGNFTINHYAGIRVEPDRVLLDVVVDQAEIPTFQARLDFDTDGDGEVSDAEADAGRVTACNDLAPSIDLRHDGTRLAPVLVEAGLTFPAGVGGLATMRMVCGFEAAVPGGFAAGDRLAFADTSSPDRLGWREIVVAGSGVTLAAATGEAGELRTSSPSARLTAYPTNLLTQALHDASIEVVVTPGGPARPPLEIADALPVPGFAPARRRALRRTVAPEPS